MGIPKMQCYMTYSPYDPWRLGDDLPDNFVNAKLNHECVEFVRQTTGAPSTPNWRPGVKVRGNASVPAGAAIANFNGDSYLSHAAIYLDQNEAGIWVLDQWNAQGYVAKRKIRFPTGKEKSPVKDSNNGDLYYLIDPVRSNDAAKKSSESLRGRVISI
jgi:hypothetical protein